MSRAEVRELEDLPARGGSECLTGRSWARVEERAAPDLLAADGKRHPRPDPLRVESGDMGGWREVIEPGALDATSSTTWS